MTDRDTLRVGGVLGEMIEAGESRREQAPLLEGLPRRGLIGPGICQKCGERVVPRPLISGRVYRCNCGFRWTGPAASAVNTVTPESIPIGEALVELDHPVMAPKAYRLGARGEIDE